MTTKGVVKAIFEKATIIINVSSVSLRRKLNFTVTDLATAFNQEKPSTNIAKTIETTVEAE